MRSACILVAAVMLPLQSVAAQTPPVSTGPLLAVAPTTGQGLEWAAWTARMSKAQQSLNYDATLVIDHGRDWELVEVTQRIGPHVPEQQVVALNGERRRYVHTAQGVSILGPDGDRRIGQGPDPANGMQVASVAGAYRVSVGARDRVAGRTTVHLSIDPLSDDRFGLELWLDADTGLPLRSERLAADGSVLERRMVTRLHVLGFAGMASSPARRQTAPAPTWTLPTGFVQVGEVIAVPGIPGGRQWILSDGLAWVSVYRLPLQAGRKPVTTGWRRGAMGQVAINANDSWIYVLGDLPSPTLERVGAAVLAAPP